MTFFVYNKERCWEHRFQHRPNFENRIKTEEKEVQIMPPYVLPIIVGVACALVFGFLGIVVGIAYRKKVAEAEIGSAEQEAKRIIEEGKHIAEQKKKEALKPLQRKAFFRSLLSVKCKPGFSGQKHVRQNST
jgi:hypothetical protein